MVAVAGGVAGAPGSGAAEGASAGPGLGHASNRQFTDELPLKCVMSRRPMGGGGGAYKVHGYGTWFYVAGSFGCVYRICSFV